MYFKHQWNDYFSNRLQVSYLKVSGTDLGSRSYAVRNLSFQTPIYEIAEMVEFNFQRFGLNYNNKLLSPYVFFGVAAFRFEPTRLENTDINLHNLKTEGQKKSYSLIQPSVPMGFGIKAAMKPRKNHGIWILGLEGFWRKTFTDYLDDVNADYPSYKAMVDNQGVGSAQYSHAQTQNGGQPYNTGTSRGDTHLKDWYFFLGFTIAYRIPGSPCAGL